MGQHRYLRLPCRHCDVVWCWCQEQDPAVWSDNAQQIMKNTTELRYYLLPFIYTQFYFSHISGSPVIQPLFFMSVAFSFYLFCCRITGIFRRRMMGVKTPPMTSPVNIFSPCNSAYIIYLFLLQTSWILTLLWLTMSIKPLKFHQNLSF